MAGAIAHFDSLHIDASRIHRVVTASVINPVFIADFDATLRLSLVRESVPNGVGGQGVLCGGRTLRRVPAHMLAVGTRVAFDVEETELRHRTSDEKDA